MPNEARCPMCDGEKYVGGLLCDACGGDGVLPIMDEGILGTLENAEESENFQSYKDRIGELESKVREEQHCNALLREEMETYRNACSCADLVVQVDELERRNKHLQAACEKLSAVTWSGHNCSKCGLPAAETEYVVNHGLCDRCMNKMLNDDEWKNVQKIIEDIRDSCKGAGVSASTLVEIYEDILGIVRSRGATKWTVTTSAEDKPPQS